MTDAIKVLVVDDHPMVRQGLRSFLEVQDDIVVVGEAFDGASCIAAAERLAPNVILLDIRMPGTDGVFALRGLRDRGNPARVLVVTSFTDPAVIVPAMRAGAAGYVYKDVDPPALAAAIRSVHAGHVLLHPDVARMLAEGDSRADAARLTSRELDVLREVGRGLSNKEIARVMALSEKTIKVYMSGILSKLELQDRTQAALYAVRMGLVSLAGK